MVSRRVIVEVEVVGSGGIIRSIEVAEIIEIAEIAEVTEISEGVRISLERIAIGANIAVEGAIGVTGVGVVVVCTVEKSPVDIRIAGTGHDVNVGDVTITEQRRLDVARHGSVSRIAVGGRGPVVRSTVAGHACSSSAHGTTEGSCGGRRARGVFIFMLVPDICSTRLVGGLCTVELGRVVYLS